MNDVFKQFGEKAQFIFVYIQEAHPTDGWQLPVNERDGVLHRQPQSLEERQQVCSLSVEQLKLGMLTLVDTMDNKTGQDYTGWPDRLYVVDKQGKIAYKGGPGPRGFRPDELSKFLEEFTEKADQKPEPDAIISADG